MEKKGYVGHEADGKTYRYLAKVNQVKTRGWSSATSWAIPLMDRPNRRDGAGGEPRLSPGVMRTVASRDPAEPGAPAMSTLG